MHRRKLLTGLAGLGLAASTAPLWVPKDAYALGLPKDKIKRIRYYINPKRKGGLTHEPTFNQSANIVVIETEGGLSGIGEGGTPDMMNQCAGMLIGEDPFRIEHLWQEMFRGYFYPAGHEKIDALGALDLALWDLKGKALGVPVWQLLGGKSRDHVECYATGGFPVPPGGTLEDAARACIAAGFAAYRYQTNLPSNEVDRFALVDKMAADCALIRKGVGQSGRWAIDFHQELDPEDAVTLCTLIEPLHPYFCEDLVRSENWETYKIIRSRTRVPIATGEEFGAKWDINALIEQQLIDYARVTLPNVGGITEYMKIQALAETHYCGMIPHFTGPVGEAALVHCLTASSLPAIMETGGKATMRDNPYLPEGYDFHDGKMWPNDRPGLGVTLDASQLHLAADYTEHYASTQLNHRPDGSFTNW
ncbi:MAG TPA: mandelate racemase/muconate lactonizing enzyme family protein [Caulobacteraceae bacterium]|nr:mandelate racemase/muconate lactonizing enzyme family protein [Caulobacteraceae bacterium]